MKRNRDTSSYTSIMSVPFPFQNDHCHDVALTAGVTMRIEVRGPAIARVSFVNHLDVELSIPPGVVIRDVTNRCTLAPLRGTDTFALCCTDGYSVHFNGTPVVELTPQRMWTIKSAL